MDPLELQQQLVDQRRGRYVRVSDVDRRQLIDTYKKGDDFIALAKKLNIKRSTGKRERHELGTTTHLICVRESNALFLPSLGRDHAISGR